MLAEVESASCDWDPAEVDGFSIELALLLGFSGFDASLGWVDPDPSDPPVSKFPGKTTTPPPPPRFEESEG